MSFLRIDTAKRENYANTSPENCEIRLANPIEGKWRLSMSCASNSFYNVEEGINNKVYITETSVGSFVIDIPSGFYTPSLLVSVLDTAINAVLTSTVTVSFSNQTGRFTFVSDTNTLSFTFGTNKTASARVILGFDEEDLPASTTIVSSNPADLTRSRFLNIDIGENPTILDGQGRTRSFLLNYTRKFSCGDRTFRRANTARKQRDCNWNQCGSKYTRNFGDCYRRICRCTYSSGFSGGDWLFRW